MRQVEAAATAVRCPPPGGGRRSRISETLTPPRHANACQPSPFRGGKILNGRPLTENDYHRTQNVIAAPRCGRCAPRLYLLRNSCPPAAPNRSPRHVFIPQEAGNARARRGLAWPYDPDPDRADAFRQWPAATGPLPLP